MQHTTYLSPAGYLTVLQEPWVLFYGVPKILWNWNTALDCSLGLMFLPFTVHGSYVGVAVRSAPPVTLPAPEFPTRWARRLYRFFPQLHTSPLVPPLLSTKPPSQGR